MFTGIVSDIGEIIHAEGETGPEARLRRFRIASGYDSTGILIGASIACSGICLTVTHLGAATHGARDTHPGSWFEVEAAAETLRLTNAGRWQVGTKLNLERAMKIGDELGGHIVTGHVDGLAEIIARDEVTPDDANWGATARFTFRVPRPLHRFIAAKGSVTLDGTSLTVNTVDDDLFSVLLIPHTLKPRGDKGIDPRGDKGIDPRGDKGIDPRGDCGVGSFQNGIGSCGNGPGALSPLLNQEFSCHGRGRAPRPSPR
jgi:riboflavin synthase